MKAENGVTITALILMVIIIIILASVSIGMITQDDDNALDAVHDLQNTTNTTLDQHNSEIANIIDEIKSANIY